MARTSKTKKGSRKSSENFSQGFSVSSNGGLVDKLQDDLQNNQSFLNLVLGALIVIVLGVILFNYFNKPQGDVGPTQQIEEQTEGDVTKDNLPGNYTIKEGDTLFSIAQNYYDDGYKYTEIVSENNLEDENQISAGQVITIPKLEASTSASEASSPSPVPSASPAESEAPSPAPQASTQPSAAPQTQNNSATWGSKITENTYTVQPGDWLSTIAGRAYGDIMQYPRIAQANNIANPNYIEVGQVLKLPR